MFKIFSQSVSFLHSVLSLLLSHMTLPLAALAPCPLGSLFIGFAHLVLLFSRSDPSHHLLSWLTPFSSPLLLAIASSYPF